MSALAARRWAVQAAAAPDTPPVAPAPPPAPMPPVRPAPAARTPTGRPADGRVTVQRRADIVPRVRLDLSVLNAHPLDTAGATSVFGVAAASAVEQACARVAPELPQTRRNAIAVEVASILTEKNHTAVYESLARARGAIASGEDVATALADGRGRGNHYGEDRLAWDTPVSEVSTCAPD